LLYKSGKSYYNNTVSNKDVVDSISIVFVAFLFSEKQSDSRKFFIQKRGGETYRSVFAENVYNGFPEYTGGKTFRSKCKKRPDVWTKAVLKKELFDALPGNAVRRARGGRIRLPGSVLNFRKPAILFNQCTSVKGP